MVRQAVWKYEIGLLKVIEMPKNSIIINTNYDWWNKPCIWAIVNLDETETEKRCFRILETGQEFYTLSKTQKYIGSIFYDVHQYIVHVFEDLSLGAPEIE